MQPPYGRREVYRPRWTSQDAPHTSSCSSLWQRCMYCRYPRHNRRIICLGARILSLVLPSTILFDREGQRLQHHVRKTWSLRELRRAGGCNDLQCQNQSLWRRRCHRDHKRGKRPLHILLRRLDRQIRRFEGYGQNQIWLSGYVHNFCSQEARSYI